jgi:hypothetical protein
MKESDLVTHSLVTKKLSAICKPNPVFLSEDKEATITLCDLPEIVSPGRSVPIKGLISIRGLAPREVYRDPEDYSSGGGLLHRRFTLTKVDHSWPSQAVCFL